MDTMTSMWDSTMLDPAVVGDFLYGSEFNRRHLALGEPMPDWMAQALGLQDYPDICARATYREFNTDRTYFVIRWDDQGVLLIVENGEASWSVAIDQLRVRPIERDEALALLSQDQ